VDRREIETRVETYVRAAFKVSPTDPGFDRTTDLFEAGYVDSVGVVELLQFLEVEFGVEIPEDDLLSDDFARIDGIAAAVCRLIVDGPR
jgi:acyl carrier protein